MARILPQNTSHDNSCMVILMEVSERAVSIVSFITSLFSISIRVEVESDDSLDNQVVNVRLGEFNEEMTALKGTILI